MITVEFRRANDTSSGLLGWASVKIMITDTEGIEIRDCVVREGKSGPFVSLPSKKGKDRSGAEKWFPIVRLSDALYKEVQDAVLSEVGRGGDAF
jgi:DNA-binding cell septation regulator SpoVG